MNKQEKIIQEALNNLDGIWKETNTQFKDGFLIDSLKKFINQTMERIVETTIFKIIKIIGEDQINNQETILERNGFRFVLSKNQKEFKILFDNQELLIAIFKTTTQEDQLIKIALDNNVYKSKKEQQEAKNLINNRIECETKIEFLGRLFEALREIDMEFYQN